MISIPNSEYIVWFTTVDSNLTPQPRPVWFVPDGDDVQIYSRANTAKIRHLVEHAQVSLHFNTDDEGGDPVIVLTGTAAIDENMPAAKDNQAYIKKYKSGIEDLEMSLDQFSKDYARPIRVKINHIRGW